MNDFLDAFGPQHLSPAKVELRERSLPCGLRWEQLASCLPALDVRLLGEARCFASHEIGGPTLARGAGGNTSIVTLRYPTVDGGAHELTVFMKRQVDPVRFEEPRYRFLESWGIPTPDLLTAVRDDGGEVLVLEFLPTIGIDFAEPSEVQALLRLIARWNAIDAAPDLVARSAGIPEDVFSARVRSALSEIDGDPSIDFELDVDEWFDVYVDVEKAYRAVPHALTHGEFYFMQVGWSIRGEERRLVVFDLEAMDRRARFGDVSSILRPLAMQTGVPEVELFETYLASYREFARCDVTAGDAYPELRLVRALSGFWQVRWGLDNVRRDDADVNSLVSMLHTMKEDLTVLGML